MARKRAPLSVTPGSIVREFDRPEIHRVLSEWLRAFGKNRAGVHSEAFLWHIFSAAKYPALSGGAAQAEYAKHLSPEYVVLSNDRDQAVITDVRPEACSLRDYFVFPPNLAWTMAFTHEDGWLGPYFAKHANYAKLQHEVEAKLLKAQEAAQAREKGWS